MTKYQVIENARKQAESEMGIWLEALRIHHETKGNMKNCQAREEKG